MFGLTTCSIFIVIGLIVAVRYFKNQAKDDRAGCHIFFV
jgi:hypothetical protein